MASPAPNFNVSSRSGDDKQEDAEKHVEDPKPRPRGRPRGSKNKPKPPTNITVGQEICVFEVAPGTDVVASLINLAQVKKVGITVHSATGFVTGAISFQHNRLMSGYYNIVSLNGTIMCPDGLLPQPVLTMFVGNTNRPTGMSGGIVNGPIIAAGPIFVTAVFFPFQTFHKLPLEGTENGNLEPGSIQTSGSELYLPVYNNISMQPDWMRRPNGGGSLF